MFSGRWLLRVRDAYRYVGPSIVQLSFKVTDMKRPFISIGMLDNINSMGKRKIQANKKRIKTKTNIQWCPGTHLTLWLNGKSFEN